MDPHRSRKRTETSSLTADQVAKLDRLAELARSNPTLMDVINRKLEDEAKTEILLLSTDELEALANQLTD